MSKEEHLEFSKKFIENICQRQANKNYYGYLEKWRKIIFRENITICAMYPFDSDSGFEFKIVNKSMLVGMYSNIMQICRMLQVKNEYRYVQEIY